MSELPSSLLPGVKRRPGRPKKAEKLPASAGEIENLRAMGLPADYFDLAPRFRKKARLKVLRSWFSPDPSHANILCTDVEAFVRAMQLWVEFYIKPDPYNAGVYTFPDPSHKYEMVRMSMSDPKVKTLPAKTVIIAPRGTTKTITFRDECLMIVTCRTVFTEVLFSEINAPRTSEEFRKMRLQIERNETIHADFGGPGTLFPVSRMSGERWNDSVLEFTHCNCTLYGFSANAATRGRHPIFGVIDDPEDDKKVRQVGWRRQFFDWLFRTYVPMFGPGGKLVWMQTPPNEASAVYIPMRGVETMVGWRGEGTVADKDSRFEDWNKKNFMLFYDDGKTGERKSIWQHKYDVNEEQSLRQSLGPQAFMAEMQGIPIASGQFVFQRDPFAHGYMRTDDGLMLDLRTGEEREWDEFSSKLMVVGAGDLSDSIAPDADPGALVFLGVSEEGIVYVLDAFIKRCHADDLVRKGFDMAAEWDCDKLGFEQEAMQSVLVRYAYRLADELRKKGLNAPVIRGVMHARQPKQKIRRILSALTPLLGEHRMRFPYFKEHEKYTPRFHKNARYIEILKEQVDFFTDEGASGNDDGVDACEMAITLAGPIRARTRGAVETDNEREYRLWHDAGITLRPEVTPRGCWTEEMHRQADPHPVGSAVAVEVDPYEGS